MQQHSSRNRHEISTSLAISVPVLQAEGAELRALVESLTRKVRHLQVGPVGHTPLLRC